MFYLHLPSPSKKTIEFIHIPSGKLTELGKSPCLLGKSMISMVIFNSCVGLEGNHFVALSPAWPVLQDMTWCDWGLSPNNIKPYFGKLWKNTLILTKSWKLETILGGVRPYTKSRPSIFWVIHLSSMMILCPSSMGVRVWFCKQLSLQNQWTKMNVLEARPPESIREIAKGMLYVVYIYIYLFFYIHIIEYNCIWVDMSGMMIWIRISTAMHEWWKYHPTRGLVLSGHRSSLSAMARMNIASMTAGGLLQYHEMVRVGWSLFRKCLREQSISRSMFPRKKWHTGCKWFKIDHTASAIGNNQVGPLSVFKQRREWDIDGSIRTLRCGQKSLMIHHHTNLRRAFYQAPFCNNQRNDYIQITQIGKIKHGNGTPPIDKWCSHVQNVHFLRGFLN